MRRRTSARRPPKAVTAGPLETFIVDSLTHEAKGVARLQGKVTFIEGALPEEEVEARVIKPGRRFDEAKLVRIIKESPYRVIPSCLHFEQCGGCSFQHLSEHKQLQSKETWLNGQLRNLSFDEPLSILSDKPTAYRRRARIAVQTKGDKLSLGFRGKSSKEIVPIDNCLVLTGNLQKSFLSLKQALANHSIKKKLGHIELLDDSKGVSVLFRLINSINDAERQDWLLWAESENVELYWQAPELSKADVASDKMRQYELDGMLLSYHPQDFVQVNGPMNEKMVTQAIEWLEPTNTDVVLDLFCGVGNFSLPLAKKALSVIGVEVQESMVEAARMNAHANGLDNLSFVAADLTKPIAEQFVKKGVSKVLLDPPRAGAFEFLDTLIKVGPQQILYVSCNASTLARDAEYLVAKGYQVLRVSLMDMFPQTSHVEIMMLLQKRSKKGK